MSGKKWTPERRQEMSERMRGNTRLLGTRRSDEGRARIRGAGNPNWRGGRAVHKGSGYIWVHAPWHPSAQRNGKIAEHRLVMSMILGMVLDPAWVVHHIDHDRQNNDPSNLQVLPNASAHMKLHRAERRAQRAAV